MRTYKETSDNLSKELYEASGWGGTSWDDLNNCPRYTFGYLFRKLTPVFLSQDDADLARAMRLICKAPHPEDSLCKLAIKLCKEGLL